MRCLVEDCDDETVFATAKAQKEHNAIVHKPQAWIPVACTITDCKCVTKFGDRVKFKDHLKRVHKQSTREAEVNAPALQDVEIIKFPFEKLLKARLDKEKLEKEKLEE
jgi:hypothetical protein